MMNIWTAHTDFTYWTGKLNDENLPVTAEYQFVANGEVN